MISSFLWENDFANDSANVRGGGYLVNQALLRRGSAAFLLGSLQKALQDASQALLQRHGAPFPLAAFYG